MMPEHGDIVVVQRPFTTEVDGEKVRGSYSVVTMLFSMVFPKETLLAYCTPSGASGGKIAHRIAMAGEPVPEDVKAEMGATWDALEAASAKYKEAVARRDAAALVLRMTHSDREAYEAWDAAVADCDVAINEAARCAKVID